VEGLDHGQLVVREVNVDDDMLGDHLGRVRDLLPAAGAAVRQLAARTVEENGNLEENVSCHAVRPGLPDCRLQTLGK
jgi:hypothetical protein